MAELRQIKNYHSIYTTLTKLFTHSVLSAFYICDMEYLHYFLCTTLGENDF